MTAFLTVLVSILEIIVILAVLISLHEAGHLGMAKLFHVYCFEYSIGFGPKILRVKRKTGETYFRISALPLGGYVSMYGEEDSVPEGFDAATIDPSRALPNKPKWQQALIMVAGVTVNFILGLILIFVADIAFPVYYASYRGATFGTSENQLLSTYSPVESYGDAIIKEVNQAIQDRPELKDYTVSDFYLAFPLIYEDNLNQIIYIDDVAGISNTAAPFIVSYYPNSLVEGHSLSASVAFYDSEELTQENKYYQAFQDVGFSRCVSAKVLDPNVSTTEYNVKNAPDGTTVTFEVTLVGLHFSSGEDSGSSETKRTQEESYEIYRDAFKNRSVSVPITLKAKSGAWIAEEGYELKIGTISSYLGWNGAWQAWASDVPRACGAIVQGIGSLFTGGWKNLSGIVGMTAALPAMAARGGAHQIFFFAGLLSINLAFFNLLPFPGLDGWQLVSIAFEAITRKRIPTKVKGIISIVGMALLFLLVIIITVKDVVNLFIR